MLVDRVMMMELAAVLTLLLKMEFKIKINLVMLLCRNVIYPTWRFLSRGLRWILFVMKMKLCWRKMKFVNMICVWRQC